LTANGRRRKKLIHSLEKEGGRLLARNIFRRLFIATTRIYLANILRKGVSMGRGPGRQKEDCRGKIISGLQDLSLKRRLKNYFQYERGFSTGAGWVWSSIL
jgi:hypothetical protein